MLTGDSPTLGINDTIVDTLTTEQLVAMRAELIDAAQSGALADEIGFPYSMVSAIEGLRLGVNSPVMWRRVERGRGVASASINCEYDCLC